MIKVSVRVPMEEGQKTLSFLNTKMQEQKLMTLFEFSSWLFQLKGQNAKIFNNSNSSIVVITTDKYYVCYI